MPIFVTNGYRPQSANFLRTSCGHFCCGVNIWRKKFRIGRNRKATVIPRRPSLQRALQFRGNINTQSTYQSHPPLLRQAFPLTHLQSLLSTLNRVRFSSELLLFPKTTPYVSVGILEFSFRSTIIMQTDQFMFTILPTRRCLCIDFLSPIRRKVVHFD